MIRIIRNMLLVLLPRALPRAHLSCYRSLYYQDKMVNVIHVPDTRYLVLNALIVSASSARRTGGVESIFWCLPSRGQEVFADTSVPQEFRRSTLSSTLLPLGTLSPPN